jgi:predicted GTPase
MAEPNPMNSESSPVFEPDPSTVDPVLGSEQTRLRSFSTPITKAWKSSTEFVGGLLPLDQVGQTVASWFKVSDEEVARILAAVRAELPTTEALLLGKPQAGKSSIVRGLTGVSAEIIGQGFRPHTKHTERYDYPSSDLPLLVFTDTVGLGDVNQDTEAIIQELTEELEEQKSRARILVLTVKITDFATDALRQIAKQLRKDHPEIPCLLVVTCLHELYPAELSDHPPYPPDQTEINRAFATMQETFKDIC